MLFDFILQINQPFPFLSQYFFSLMVLLSCIFFHRRPQANIWYLSPPSSYSNCLQANSK